MYQLRICLAVGENQTSTWSGKYFFLPSFPAAKKMQSCAVQDHAIGGPCPFYLAVILGCGFYSSRHKVTALSPGIIFLDASWSLPFISGHHSSPRTFVCVSLAWTGSPLLVRESGQSKNFSWADCYPEQNIDSFSNEEREWLLGRQLMSLFHFVTSILLISMKWKLKGTKIQTLSPISPLTHTPHVIPIKCCEHTTPKCNPHQLQASIWPWVPKLALLLWWMDNWDDLGRAFRGSCLSLAGFSHPKWKGSDCFHNFHNLSCARDCGPLENYTLNPLYFYSLWLSRETKRTLAT